MEHARTQTLLTQLSAIVGADAVLSGAEVATRTQSWSSREPCQALAVVRPRSTNEVAAVLQLCAKLGQPVVPYGGGTGLVGGAIATEHEVLLSLERMVTIEEVDPAGRTATVEAGVTLQAMQQAAESAGLFFPLDLGARGSATIGGVIATNAGGNRVLRYGMMREQVLGIEAVLPDGTILTSMNRLIKNNAGYDLRQLFVGSEGTLGVVTRAVLRLREAAVSQDVALVAVAGFPQLVALLRAIDRGLGGTLSAFEVMWPEFYELVTAPKGRYEPPLPHGLPLYCLIESLGGAVTEDRARFERVLSELLDARIVADAVIAESRAQASKLWALRDDVERILSVGPVFMFDVGLPIACMEHYVLTVRRTLVERWAAARCVVWGHVGDGNLHIWVSVQDDSALARQAVEQIVYEPLKAIGGTVSAEHGVGVEKIKYLSFSRSGSELRAMQSLKRAFDPHNLLNPGRVIPAA